MVHTRLGERRHARLHLHPHRGFSQGTVATDAWAINGSSQIVGYYQNASGVHGFLYSGGTYTTLNDPLGTDPRVARRMQRRPSNLNPA